MFEPSILTIVFRGLLVFHKNEAANVMEIGILRERHHHFPRILTYRNGVLDRIYLLEDSDLAQPLRLDVDGGEESGPSIYTNGSLAFNRSTHQDERDFRWTMDLEARDFYNRDLTGDMLGGVLGPILSIGHGEFYTRLLSSFMKRKQSGGGFADFGRVSSATGCDIRLFGQEARLMKGNERIFTFTVAPNVTYELANTPPDFPTHHQETHNTGDHFPHRAGPPDERSALAYDDHFRFYYMLFNQAFQPKYEFAPRDPDPAPDPFLCGASAMGKRPGPLS